MPRIITGSHHYDTRADFYVMYDNGVLFYITAVAPGGGIGITVDSLGDETQRWIAAPSRADVCRGDHHSSSLTLYSSDDSGASFTLQHTESGESSARVLSKKVHQDQYAPDVLWSVHAESGMSSDEMYALFSINKGVDWTKLYLSDAVAVGNYFVAPRHNGFDALVCFMISKYVGPDLLDFLRIHLVGTDSSFSYVDIDAHNESIYQAFRDGAMEQGVVLPTSEDYLVMTSQYETTDPDPPYDVHGNTIFWSYVPSTGGFAEASRQEGYFSRMVATPGGRVIIPRHKENLLQLYLSDNGGGTWSAKDFSSYIYSLRADNDYLDTVAWNYAGRLLLPLETGIGFYSDDDGDTWIPIGSVLPTGDTRIDDASGAMVY